MGEVAALSAAFEVELSKCFSSLPAIASCPPSEHDAHLLHYRGAQRIVELVAYYGSRLPAYASVHRILAYGDRLVKQNEHRLALDACYSYIKSMKIHEHREVARVDEPTRLAYHVQAVYGCAVCEAVLALQADAQIKHPDTLAALVACLQQLKEGLTLVLPSEQLYWLTLNGTVHVYNLAKRLVTAGFVAQMLPFLVYCVKALGSHVIFSTAKYLPWRTQLYIYLCYSYCDVRAYDVAKRVVQEGLDKIDALIRLQKLDPVPAPPAVQAAYRTAKGMLCALRLKLEVLSSTGAPLATLQPLLAEVAVSPKAKLTAMVEALQVPGRRVVRHEAAQGVTKELLDVVRADVAPLVAQLNQAITAAQQQPEGSADAAQTGSDGTQQPHEQQQQQVNVNPPEAEQFSVLLHKALLCTAYNFEQSAMFDELLALAQARLQHGSIGAADEQQVSVFSTIVTVLEALTRLERQPGAESLKHVSTALAGVCTMAARAVPDMLTDAALVLFAAARPLLDGVFCARDKEAPLVTDVLRTLHACWEAVELDDCLLRLGSSLKLALLLEEQANQDRGDTSLLYEARSVLVAARAAVQRFRTEHALVSRGAEDEHLRWITGSRSQPNDPTAALVAGMPDTDQELACLHTDILAALYRVELLIGVSEQQAQALNKQTRLMESVTRREEQSSIFGVRTMKEKRLDEQRITQAAATPSNPPLKERELLQGVGKNMYEKALLLMQMAPFQSEVHRQQAMLQEAAELLTKAQEREDLQFAAAQPELKGKTGAPLQPKVLQRTPTSCTLTHFPFNLKGLKKPVKYAVYAKVFGAGVALILNKTATEYPGTGIQVPLGASVTVEGLRTNDTYVFAIAAYDEQGNVIGGLGTSSAEMLAGLPLPLYHCWAHLVLMACKLKLWGIAKRATSVLFPHFIVTTPDRPLWEANPMDAQRAHTAHLQTAAKPLLRLFVQAVYAYTGAMLAHEAASQQSAPKMTSVGIDLRQPYLEEQLARLKSTKRLVLSMQMAAVLHDEMLVQEGAIRAYHILGPLLSLKHKTPLVHKALAKLYLAMQDVSNLIQNSLVGQEDTRRTASRVAAAAIYHVVTISTASGEAGAVSYFGQLQVELLKAYDPQFSVPGRPPTSELLEEASYTQDSLLMHPRLAEFGAQVLTERMKDEADLAARVLPVLSTPSPLDAWNMLGREDVVQHPRWVELVVRTIEASVRKGRLDNVKAIAAQVTWHVKTAFKRPAATFEGPRWKLDEAAAQLTTVTLTPEEEPPRPATDGLSDGDKAAAEAAYAQAREAALLTARRRVAAVILLQRRLPVLLKRKKAVATIRQQAARWQPWLARLNVILGLVAAMEARTLLAQKAQQQKGHEAGAAEGTPEAAAAAGGGTGSRPTSPSKAAGAKPGSAKGGAKPGTPKAGAKGAAVAAEAVDPAAPAPDAPLVALQHLTRAAQLATRGRAWHELLNGIRHLWNVARALLNGDASLLAPLSPAVWEQGAMPPPPTAPESLIQAPDAKPAKGAKGAPPKKEDPKAKKPPSAKGGKKGAEPPPAEPTWPPIFLPKGSKPNVARCLKAATEALLALVAQLRDGMPMWTGVLPLTNDGSSSAGAKGGVPGVGGAADAAATGRPGTQASADYASSNFSFGSDLQAELWFQKGPVDMEWVNKYMAVVLLAMNKMQRWHSIMEIGRRWLVLCEGAYSEKILPYLLAAAPGAGADPAPLQASMEVVVRDKNQALDQLDKVRRLVRERLGEPSLINQAEKARVKKKRRIAPAAQAAAAASAAGGDASSVTGDGSGGGAAAAGDDRASMASAYTLQTQSSLKTRASQPDFLRLPAEYDKVIEVLKKRGEKAAMIYALGEMGDVHAHFGNWGGATTAWLDALDTLMGPYQVLKSWRKVLDPMSRPQILQAYGLHGCLLAGGLLLGKLARYSYYGDLGMRLEACRMAATLLTAIFCNSVAHPQRRVGYALYVPREIWDNTPIFNDPYRCNMTDLLSGLETVSCVLVDNGLALTSLPVISLWEHVAYHVTRNLHATVVCRIMRVRALVQLGLMGEASSVLVGLMSGARLPDAVMDTDYVVKNEDGTVLQVPAVPPLSNRAYPSEAVNAPVLKLIAESALPAAVDKLYGSWSVAHLNMARAAFLARLGAIPNTWQSMHPTTGLPVTPDRPVPEACESQLLDSAAALFSRAMSTATGKPPDVEPPAAAGAAGGKGGKQAAKPTTPPGKKKPGAAAEAEVQQEAVLPPLDVDIGPSPDRSTSAQRCEVLVRALLGMSEMEMWRWQPHKALNHALAALKFMGVNGEKLNVALSDNDDTDRFSISPLLWLQARVQAVRCTAAMRHIPVCHSLIKETLKEAAEVNEHLTVASLLHLQATLHELSGDTAPALNAYADVRARYTSLNIRDLRLGSLLVDTAALRDRLGLREDSAALGEAAVAVLSKWCEELGLNEAQEHPELVNLYASGTALYASALVHLARCASRRRRIPDAMRTLKRALALLRGQTRALPTQHAVTAVELGRSLRLIAMLSKDPLVIPAPSPRASPAVPSTPVAGGTRAGSAKGQQPAAAPAPPASMAQQQLQGGSVLPAAGTSAASPSDDEGPAAALTQAQELLLQAITLATLDGGHARDLIRAALLGLASLLTAGGQPRRAAACLRSAHMAANKAGVLSSSSHTLAPVAVAQMPEWAKDHVRGQEAAFAAEHGNPPPTSISEVDMGRMLVCHFTALLRSASTVPVSERQRVDAHICALHAALKAACPKYASDACLPEAPLPPPTEAAAPAPAAGSVIVQWYAQDGCWQDPRSWIAQGSLSVQQVTESDVLALQPVPVYASMLFVVCDHKGAVRSGEMTFEVSAVRAMQRRVREVRHRCESPKAPTDIFGYDAPSERELAALRAQVENFLARRRASEDGSAAPGGAGGSGEGEGKEEGGAAAAAKAAAAAAGKGGKGGAPAAAGGAAAGPPAPPPTDLSFLIKLEGMLTVENGIELTDAPFAEWLSRLLPRPVQRL